jgi:hypothetical protein
MRACWYKYYSNALRTFSNWRPGKFHQWSTMYEELNNGIGQYPIALVEDEETLTIVEVTTNNICFGAKPQHLK